MRHLSWTRSFVWSWFVPVSLCDLFDNKRFRTATNDNNCQMTKLLKTSKLSSFIGIVCGLRLIPLNENFQQWLMWIFTPFFVAPIKCANMPISAESPMIRDFYFSCYFTWYRRFLILVASHLFIFLLCYFSDFLFSNRQKIRNIIKSSKIPVLSTLLFIVTDIHKLPILMLGGSLISNLGK